MRPTRALLRQKALAAFGGACQRCGYSACVRALQFHHVRKGERRATLARHTGTATARDAIAHPERYTLLCANCHFEEHERLHAAKVMTAVCGYCGNQFTTEAAKVRNGRGKYCSKQCWHAERTILAKSSLEARFWKHTQRSKGCWSWTGKLAPGGYGTLNCVRIGCRTAMMTAARVSWRLHYGEPRKGDYVHHRCGNPTCVNPKHLYLAGRVANLNPESA